MEGLIQLFLILEQFVLSPPPQKKEQICTLGILLDAGFLFGGGEQIVMVARGTFYQLQLMIQP